MALNPGTRVGPYEISVPIGAGGMGEVYRAHDTRLGRDVALKILPTEVAADPARRSRFEQEARAVAALNHPNIVAVYDVGDGYLVTELVDGEPLQGGRCGLRKTLDIAIQLASGIAAAHGAGVTHLDLKPGNVLLSRDGRVKILDFGLAKLQTCAGGHEETTSQTQTVPGTVMGTVGYMSPEQVRGLPCDPRTDIFSFGAILHELFTGKRAFDGETSAETMTAILKHDAPDLPANVPTGVRQIVARCLEKDPANRFQSARDVAFSLEAVGIAPESPAGRNEPRARWPIGAVAALVLLGVAFVLGRKTAPPSVPAPVYTQLTYRRGTISSARFSPDGQSIVYSAAWDGNPYELFVTRREFPESRPLGVGDARVLAVSSSGELAVVLGPHVNLREGSYEAGTLARVPLAGGSPREILEDVTWADWSPDGKELAIVHRFAGRSRVEFPIGKVLYEAPGDMSWLRLSPKGDRLAFFEHPQPGDDRGYVAVIDLAGTKTRLVSDEASSQEGLAWSPSGDEIFYSASYDPGGQVLHAVSLAGRRRVVMKMPTDSMDLQDLDRTGNVLAAKHNARWTAMGLTKGDHEERDLTWLGYTCEVSLSADGKLLLFGEENSVVGSNYAVCVRKMDGTAPIRLGEGHGEKISPDGKWAIARYPAPKATVLLPVGAGEARPLNFSVGRPDSVAWFADSTRVLFGGSEPGHGSRCYVLNIEPGGQPQPVTPEGTSDCHVTSDGQSVIAAAGGQYWMYPIGGGERRVFKGMKAGDRLIAWAADGRSWYVAHTEAAGLSIDLLDAATGQRKSFRQIQVPDRAGLTMADSTMTITPDGATYAYTYRRVLSDLFLAKGLK